MANAAHIIVQYPGSSTRIRSAINCVIGRDVEIRPRILQDYCASRLRPIEHDLVILAGAVAYTDRIVPRRRSSGWMRELELTIPVHDQSRWRDPGIYKSLIDVLQFVTGDAWTFNFISGAKMPELNQSSLDLMSGPFVIIPFSDGLDSFLQWKLTSMQEPSFVPLRIQTSSRASISARLGLIESTREKKDQMLRIPVRTSVGNHPEPSFRSRTFLFYSMASLAAAKAKSNRVLIGENGIGSLGPSLVPYGNESPHRTTHPGFTRRLSVLINALLETSISFHHPQMRWTKGEVLEKAVALGLSGWEHTHSCVRGPRDRLGGLPCGACSGCLLRRVSVEAAGKRASAFFWNDLSAPTLNASRLKSTGRRATNNDNDILRHAVHSMSTLEQMSKLSPDALPFQKLAWELTDVSRDDSSLTPTEIHRLVSVHAKEWSAFRERRGEASVLNLGGGN